MQPAKAKKLVYSSKVKVNAIGQSVAKVQKGKDNYSGSSLEEKALLRKLNKQQTGQKLATCVTSFPNICSSSTMVAYDGTEFGTITFSSDDAMSGVAENMFVRKNGGGMSTGEMRNMIYNAQFVAISSPSQKSRTKPMVFANASFFPSNQSRIDSIVGRTIGQGSCQIYAVSTLISIC